MARKNKKNHSSEPENRLIGWLVSYALDSKGFAFELRSGRVLISGDDSADTAALVLDEESVSSPHAALRGSPQHKLLIQDIFSEHGSYVIRAGTDKESPVNGPTKLEHGDWLKIGNSTRFQVCLINDPGC